MSSLDGVTTLRAFGVEQRFLHAFDVHQDRSTAACYLHLAADRWFNEGRPHWLCSRAGIHPRLCPHGAIPGLVLHGEGREGWGGGWTFSDF